MAQGKRKTSLTKRQREIYEFLRDKITNRGYGPTVREIGLHFDIRSPNGVMCHLKALERKGLISREQNMSRAIQLANAPKNRLTVRLIGSAAASGPVQPAVSLEESVCFQELFEGSDVGCLRIDGNNFSALNIVSGDMLMISRDAPLQAGCHVAALDDRHSLIICLVQEGSSHLVPVITTAYSPTTRQVIGVITGIVRKLRKPQVVAVESAAS